MYRKVKGEFGVNGVTTQTTQTHQTTQSKEPTLSDDDKKILELCREHQYSHKNLQNAIRIVYEKRHIAYEEKKAASA